MPRHTSLTGLTPLTKVAIGALEDLKGQDIKLLDVRKLTAVTDTMLICTGTSNRHVSSLAQHVFEASKKAGFPPMGMEGRETGEWVVVDLNDVVVHVMQSQARAHYQLEKLWAIDEEPVSVTTVKSKATKKRAVPKTEKKAAPKAAKKAAKKTSGARKPAAKKKDAAKAAPTKKAAKKKAGPRRG